MAQLKKIHTPDIRNYTHFTDASGNAGAMVGFGGTTKPTAMAWLKDEGFSAVINLRHSSEKGADIGAERGAADAAWLTYIHLPFDVRNPKSDLIDNFTAAVEDRTKQPVYIYCNSATRVAALWMIHRVQRDGLQIDKAQREAEYIAANPYEAITFALSVLSKEQ